MNVAHARALLERNDCRIEPFDPMGDAEALRRLAAWAMRYSPLVAPDPPDGLLIDITGCQRFFRGERRLIARIARDLRTLGFTSRIAAASTFGCAWAAARFDCGSEISNLKSQISNSHAVVSTGREREALAPLPVRGLRIDEETAEALEEVAITHIGHLFDLSRPRNELASRFGGDLLLRLDQATGEAFETIEPIRPTPPLQVERAFDGPTTNLEGIELTVQDLLTLLCALLQRRERGVRKLNLELERIDCEPVHSVLSLSMPSRNPRHLWSLLRPRVEQINLGFGVERITLTALRTASLPHEQSEHWGQSPSPFHGRGVRGKGELIDTIAARFDPNRISRIELLESHLPESSFRRRSAMEDALRQPAQPEITSSERPTVLLQNPMMIGIESSDGVPSRIFLRDIDHCVTTCIGPERLSLAWWKRKDGRPMCWSFRDYFKVQDEHGRWLWIYRESESGRWFAHGVWA